MGLGDHNQLDEREDLESLKSKSIDLTPFEICQDFVYPDPMESITDTKDDALYKSTIKQVKVNRSTVKSMKYSSVKKSFIMDPHAVSQKPKQSELIEI
jgi:hypothetical protein